MLGHTGLLSEAGLAICKIIPSLHNATVHVVLAQQGPLIPLLERAGASVEVLAMDEWRHDVRKSRIRPTKLPLRSGVQGAIYVVKLAWRLRQLRPDVVDTTTLTAARYVGIAARLARIPRVPDQAGEEALRVYEQVLEP
jgi:hypothetical protein